MQGKIIGWLQVAAAIAAAVSQILAGFHGAAVDSGHVALTAAIAASGYHNITHA